MRSSYKKIGSFVKQVNVRNKDLSVTNLQGININKFFMPSVANTNGTDLSKYKVVAQKQFAFNPMHVGRDEVLPISMLEAEDSVIVSPAYVVFKVKDETQLLPEYLMMWCRRPEFDRNAWFTTDSSVRGGFSWKDFCDLTLPVPTIEKQREIVREYHTIVDRIKLNEQLNQKLEETAQAIYKQWFVDFEFPMSKEHAAEIGKPELEGKPYKSSGGKMVWNDVLDQEIPDGWETKNIGSIINYKKGNAFKSTEYAVTGVPIVKVSNFTENSIDLTNCNFIEQSAHEAYKAYSLNTSDIIISTVGSWPHNPDSIVGKVVKVPLCANGTLLNQNTVRLRTNDSRIQEYLYCSIKNKKYSDYIISGAQGSANQASITLEHAFSYNIPVPDESGTEKAKLFFGKLSSFFRRNENEVLILHGFKDMLLSKMTKAEATA